MKFLDFFNIHKLVEAFTFYGGGKGGGGGGGGTQTSYSTNLPQYAQPFYEELLKQSGKQIYETDASGAVTGVKKYVPYTGDRIAGFTPEQERIQQEVAGLTSPGGFQQAASTLGTVGYQAGAAGSQGLQQALGYTPQQIQAQQLMTGRATQPGVVQGYMDPYTQAVIDVEKREALREAAKQQQAAAMSSIGRGTFGGGREALMSAERDRATQQLLADIQAKGGQRAYEQALAAFQADEARQLEAQKANQAAGLQAQELMQQGAQFQAGLGKDVGLAGLQTGLETAKATGALSATEQMANLERLKAQAASAGEKQALEQEQLNLAYQQFMDEQDYQRRLLEYQSNILRGNAAALGSTQVQYAPGPSLASQIGGLGLAGLGLYNILGQG